MATPYKVLSTTEGLVRHSVPGETLLFKMSGNDPGGALDYVVLEVQPNSGPPLHVHLKQQETIHFVEGRYKVQLGQEVFTCERGGFVCIPPGTPHAFMNIAETSGQCIITFTPGGSERFFEEFSPVVRREGPLDHAEIASVFRRHDWEVVGPPLAAGHAD